MENNKPNDLTSEQKLKIRDMQLEMANIAIRQTEVVKAFEDLKKKHGEIEESMQKFSESLGTKEQLKDWVLNEKLDWVERPAQA